MNYEQRAKMNRFSDMLWALGDSEPSRQQADRLISWAVQNIDFDYWSTAANEAAMAGCGAVYTELTMRIGEGC
jgi:hypothetical protein